MQMMMGPANHLSVLGKHSPQPPSFPGRKHLPKHTAPGKKHPQSPDLVPAAEAVWWKCPVFLQCSNTAVLSGKVSFHPADATLCQQKYFHGVALNLTTEYRLFSMQKSMPSFFQALGANHFAQSADRLLQASSSF